MSIGHFRDSKTLTFKPRLAVGAIFPCENEVCLHENKKIIFITMASHLASL